MAKTASALTEEEPKLASVFAQIMAKRLKKEGSPIQSLDDIVREDMRKEVEQIVNSSDSSGSSDTKS